MGCSPTAWLKLNDSYQVSTEKPSLLIDTLCEGTPPSRHEQKLLIFLFCLNNFGGSLLDPWFNNSQKFFIGLTGSWVSGYSLLQLVNAHEEENMKDGSTVKTTTGCSSRGPGFCTQNSWGTQQPSVAPVVGALLPSSGICQHPHSCAQTHSQTHEWRNKI